VAGYTDNIGGAGYNRGLSKERAQQVVDYLINRGVPRNRLRAVGHGPASPVADNSTEEGRALNRRVELRFVP